MAGKSIEQRLFDAVGSAIPSCSGMFTNVPECSPTARNDGTNPSRPSGSHATAGSAVAARTRFKGDVTREDDSCSRMFPNVHECSPQGRNDKTDPIAAAAPDLTPRQVAAARLLALGRSGTAVAAEVGVEKHTITRWRRLPAFAVELRRQNELILAEQVRQRRAEQVDAFAVVADRAARKYGIVR